MNDYSVFLASDSYVRPDTEKMTDQSMIANALFAKENLERFMEDTRGLTSCGQLSERIGEAWGMSAVKLQVQMADKVLGDDNGYKNAPAISPQAREESAILTRLRETIPWELQKRLNGFKKKRSLRRRQGEDGAG